MRPPPPADWTILQFLANHLWQSTIVAAGAGLLAWRIGPAHPRVRYAIWLVASLKFLVPFAVLTTLGGRLPWPDTAEVTSSPISVAAVQAIGQPFSLGYVQPIGFPDAAVTPASSTGLMLRASFILWASGGVVVFLVRLMRWQRVAEVLKQTQRLSSGRVADAWRRLQAQSKPVPIALLPSHTPLEPSVFGIFRPVLLWPSGIADRLSAKQLDAVLMHELCHVRLHHNLISCGHMVVETLFWFYPLVWRVGAQTIAERERVCDEDVVRRGASPAAYAEGILTVCECCLESRLACQAGIGSSRLLSRIEAIMTHSLSQRLGWPRRLLLGAAASLLLIGPVAAGAVHASSHAPAARAPIAAVGDARPASTRTSAAPQHEATIAPLTRMPDAARFVAPQVTAAQPVPIGRRRLSGVVTDQGGLLVAGATVTAVAVSTGTVARTVVSDADGRYVMTDLAPGDYDVRVQLPAFRTVTQRVALGVQADAIANARLLIGAVTETITIIPPGADATITDEQTAEAAATRSAQEARLLEQTRMGATGLLSQSSIVSTYFDLARLYYSESRFTESGDMVARAAELLERQALAARPVAPQPGTRGGGEVKEPRKTRDQKPIYPAAAAAAQVAGVVILEAKISEVGTVKDAKVLRSIPSLDQAALGAVRQWRFTPTLLNGVPIEVLMTVTMTFAQQ